ncbi:MAG: M48 family metalloprotease [Candidatus Aminicenantes bacterium]|nr:M48 family metalloprotease [Candidatus Aminicenantes bacterium]
MRASVARILGILVMVGVLLTPSSASFDQLGGVLSKVKKTADDAKKVVEVGQKLRSGFAEITEEEEYYIGRSVAAMILSKYPVYQNAPLTQYVNLVGNAVAVYSDRPEIYARYHFQVLDTEEVNALAAPGGLIFVSKGLLRRCQDEEMLGLILAHEIGHVAAKHGLQAIKKSRLTEVFTSLGMQAAQSYGPQELAQLTTMFEGVLSDIVEQLVERGYSRASEYEADGLAVTYGVRTGFDPKGIVRFLQTMVGDKSAASGKGWFKTHPTPEQRMTGLNKQIAALGDVPKVDDARTKRFDQAFNSLK